MNGRSFDYSYHISDTICPICKKDGYIILMEQMGNHFVCPICKSSFNRGPSTFENVLKEFYESFQSNNELLDDYTSPHPWCSYLDTILLEIRRSLLMGSYISALAVLGFYVELLVKEIYFAHNGMRFNGTLGKAIDEVKDIVDGDEFKVLKEIKNKLRNPITHGNFAELLSDVYVAESLPSSNQKTLVGLRELLKTDGQYYVEASRIPTIVFSVSYETFFKQLAFDSYNTVYSLAFYLSFKYLSMPYKKSEMEDSENHKLTPEEFDKMCEDKGLNYYVIKQKKHIVMTKQSLNKMLE